MNNRLLTRITITGIKKNKKTLIPFLTAGTFTVMIFYIIESLAYCPYIYKDGVEAFYGAQTIAVILELAATIIGFFAIIFMIYANRFVTKGRKKEMALYGVLGMSKRNITCIMALETLINTGICIGAGILAGTFLNKLMLLMLYKIIGQEAVNGMVFSGRGFIVTLTLFVIIFACCLIINVTSIRVGNPIDLLKSDKTGEKEPKVKILTLIIGILALAAGYYIALTTKTTGDAISVLVTSVILVIIGTYCLFISGSIFVLKMLKKNKKYYFKTRNFISVSNLMYRMKHNAAGLASICVLSTAVILLLTCGASLMALGEKNINERYPNDVKVLLRADYAGADNEYAKLVKRAAEESGIEYADIISREYKTTVFNKEGNTYFYLQQNQFIDIASSRDVYMLTVDDYNRYSGRNIKLEKGEILLYTSDAPSVFGKNETGDSTIIINKNTYKVVGEAELTPINYIINPTMSLFDKAIFVFADEQEMNQVAMNDSYNGVSDDYEIYIGYDLKNEPSQESVKQFTDSLMAADSECSVGLKSEDRTVFYNVYGGVFFVGIFMSVLFLIATVMIIYYKQMSEGYEDQKRFDILSKVGLTEKEAKTSIKRQVMILFFMPVAAAVIHTFVAANIIRLFLKLLLPVDALTFYASIGAVCVIFFVVYTLVYRLTSSQYYRIVYAGRSWLFGTPNVM